MSPANKVIYGKKSLAPDVSTLAYSNGNLNELSPSDDANGIVNFDKKLGETDYETSAVFLEIKVSLSKISVVSLLN